MLRLQIVLVEPTPTAPLMLVRPVTPHVQSVVLAVMDSAQPAQLETISITLTAIQVEIVQVEPIRMPRRENV